MHLGLKDGDPQIQHVQEMKISPLFFEIWNAYVLIKLNSWPELVCYRRVETE